MYSVIEWLLTTHCTIVQMYKPNQLFQEEESTLSCQFLPTQVEVIGDSPITKEGKKKAGSPRGRPRPRTRLGSCLQPGDPLGRPDIDRLFDLDPRHFLARLVEAQHGIVVHLEPLPVNLGFKHFRTRNDVIPEDNLLTGAPQLQHRQQLPARDQVLLDRIVHAGAKHLPRIPARGMPRRDVEAIGLRPPLWIQRQGHLLHPNGEVQGMPPVFGPQAVVPDAHQALHPNLADAGRHTARLHRLPAGQRVFAFDPWIAGDTLLTHPRRAPIHRFLKGTLLHTLLVPPAPILVNQDNPILRPFVDGLPRTGCQTARIGTVVTNPLQVEEEGLMLRQGAALHLPRFIPREPGLIDAFDQGAHRRGRVLINVDEPPFLVRRDVADRRLANLGPGIKDRHPFEHPVRCMVLAADPHIPHLPAGIDLLNQLRDLHIVELRIPAVGLGLHVVPPHILLALREQPGGLIRHRAGLARQTPIDVKHEGELPLGMSLFVGIEHLPSQLPIIHFRHNMYSFHSR